MEGEYQLEFSGRLILVEIALVNEVYLWFHDAV